MIIIDVEKIKKLRNYLDDACYDTLNQKIRQHQNYFLVHCQTNMIIFN